MTKHKLTETEFGKFAVTVVVAMVANVGLFAYGAIREGEITYSYLLINLVLAAVPLLFVLRLHKVLRTKRWSDWEPIGWSLLWILFLPNSFYMVSDYIHLRNVPADQILYAAVLFTSFIALGLILGFCSMYLVHRLLRLRLGSRLAAGWMGVLLLLCSFAIYIGRDLRWNSWDVIFNPAGLLFDVSDRLLRPAGYPNMIITVVSFFVMLTSLYAVVWAGLNVLYAKRSSQ